MQNKNTDYLFFSVVTTNYVFYFRALPEPVKPVVRYNEHYNYSPAYLVTDTAGYAAFALPDGSLDLFRFSLKNGSILHKKRLKKNKAILLSPLWVLDPVKKNPVLFYSSWQNSMKIFTAGFTNNLEYQAPRETGKFSNIILHSAGAGTSGIYTVFSENKNNLTAVNFINLRSPARILPVFSGTGCLLAQTVSCGQLIFILTSRKTPSSGLELAMLESGQNPPRLNTFSAADGQTPENYSINIFEKNVHIAYTSKENNSAVLRYIHFNTENESFSGQAELGAAAETPHIIAGRENISIYFLSPGGEKDYISCQTRSCDQEIIAPQAKPLAENREISGVTHPTVQTKNDNTLQDKINRYLHAGNYKNIIELVKDNQEPDYIYFRGIAWYCMMLQKNIYTSDQRQDYASRAEKTFAEVTSMTKDDSLRARCLIWQAMILHLNNEDFTSKKKSLALLKKVVYDPILSETSYANDALFYIGLVYKNIGWYHAAASFFRAVAETGRGDRVIWDNYQNKFMDIAEASRYGLVLLGFKQ
ncbi:MAG: hypothetical protein A2096_16270 [Spirochaetes bacterium GWF1_41_5]|nr:MAG: hypothetical protein A2096_16270 [Spirochaetes bacterium GWF1_41_5]